MSEENPLVKSDDPNTLAALDTLGAMQKYEESTFEQVAKSADYLCRLQLCGSNSTLFKLNKISKCHYAYVVTKDQFSDLGPSVDVMPLCWRPKALDMSGDTPISFFDVTSPEFKDVSERSFKQDSNCTYGPEYLVWIPTLKKFGILHFNSKTSRKDAPDMHKLLRKGVTLTHRIVGPNDKGQIWESIKVDACSTPFDMFDLEVAKATIEKFNNEASAKAPEKADTTNTRAR